MALIGLPVDFHGCDKSNAVSELVIHASEVGLCLQTFKDMPLGKKISFKVSFPKGTEFESFRVVAEVVWKDIHFWEDWKGYQYALKFVETLGSHYLKLERLLLRLPGMEKIPAQIDHRGLSV
jgi:hypothetical protein